MLTVAPDTNDTVLKLMSSPEVPTVQSMIVVPAEVAIRAHDAVPVAFGVTAAPIPDQVREAADDGQH